MVPRRAQREQGRRNQLSCVLGRRKRYLRGLALGFESQRTPYELLRAVASCPTPVCSLNPDDKKDPKPHSSVMVKRGHLPIVCLAQPSKYESRNVARDFVTKQGARQ